MIETVQKCEFRYHVFVLVLLEHRLTSSRIHSGEFVKGDMYIRDLRHTSGHISSISSLSWHPTNPSLFLTASSDSTLRIWDKTNRRSSKSVIVVKSKERGGKTKVTSCCWSKPDGKLIAAASEDGSLMIWKASGNFTRPDYVRLSFNGTDGDIH
jgi:WD40 repeat protein